MSVQILTMKGQFESCLDILTGYSIRVTASPGGALISMHAIFAWKDRCLCKSSVYSGQEKKRRKKLY